MPGREGQAYRKHGAGLTEREGQAKKSGQRDSQSGRGRLRESEGRTSRKERTGFVIARQNITKNMAKNAQCQVIFFLFCSTATGISHSGETAATGDLWRDVRLPAPNLGK